ncbi:MAG TPA: hypothetical protein VMB34_26260 [Acetobacteraceae bacterium]|nr:hypothetical protein [Acetobacteraceae bacterium]
MDSVNRDRTPEDEDFEATLRDAQNKLAAAEHIAALNGDPSHALIVAMAAYTRAMAAFHGLERQKVNQRLGIVDSRLDEVQQIHAELREASARATDAAKAEMGRAQAEVARQAGGVIAAAAAQQFRTMTRTSWLWSVAAAVGVALVVFVTGGALGFAWGNGAAAHTIRSADPIVHFVATNEGPGAVQDWNTLMRYNPIKALWAECSGSKVAVQNGRKACNFWLWIGPPAGFTPAGG